MKTLLFLFGLLSGLANADVPRVQYVTYKLNPAGTYLIHPFEDQFVVTPTTIPLNFGTGPLPAGTLMTIFGEGKWDNINPFGPGSGIYSHGGGAAVFVDQNGNFIPPGPKTTAPLARTMDTMEIACPLGSPNPTERCSTDIPQDFAFREGATEILEVPEGAVALQFTAITSTWRFIADYRDDYKVRLAVGDLSASALDIELLNDEGGYSDIKAVASNGNGFFTYKITTPPTNGVAGVNGIGRVTYFPTNEYVGRDSLVVRVTEPVDGFFYDLEIQVEVYESPCAIGDMQCRDPVKKRIYRRGTPRNVPACDKTALGLPCNIATGVLWHTDVDFSVPGRTDLTSLDFARTYTVLPLEAGDFGPGWSHPWETRLRFNNAIADPSVIWVDEQGGPWYFQRRQGIFVSPPTQSAKLVRTESGFQLKKRDGTIYEFNSDGYVTTIRDRHGDSITMSRDTAGKLQSLSTALAGTISFERNPDGKVSRINRGGLSWTYSYDWNGRLELVTDFSGLQVAYNYDSAGRLSRIRDKLGREYRFTYYENGKAWQQFEPGGYVRTFSYSPAGDTTQYTHVKETDGTDTTYFFDSEDRTIETRYADGTKTFQTWGPDGFLESQTDQAGEETRYQYDDRGNLISVKRPTEEIATGFRYHPSFAVQTYFQPQIGSPTVTEINEANGDVSAISKTSGATTLSLSFSRDSFGNPLSVSNGLTTYSDQRDANGLLVHRFDPNNPETLTYDARARVSIRSFQSGRTLTYTYDDYDRILSVSDSSGPNTSYTYDAVGRILTRTVSKGQEEQTHRYTWDDQNRLTKEVDPEGKATVYRYDVRRRLDGPDEIVSPTGQITKFEYDVMGRKISQKDEKGATTKWTYDRRGSISTVTDAAGKETLFHYDQKGRLIREYRPVPLGQNTARKLISYSYDEVDRLVQIEHKSWTGMPSRFERFTYDDFGRLTRRSLWTGSILEDEKVFTYRPQLDGNVIATASNAVSSLNFQSQAAPPFRLTQFSVSASEAGNPKQLIEDTFSIQRDVTGEISSISGQATGQVVKRKYDAAGRMTAAKTGNLAALISFDGFGRRKEINFTSGLKGTFAYDILNRIENIAWNNGIEQSLAYNKAGNIAALERENGTYSLSYDEVDQLAGVKHKAKRGIENYTRSFGYDLLGNRTQDSKVKDLKYSGDFLMESSTHLYKDDGAGFGELMEEINRATGKKKSYSYRADGRIKGFESEGKSVTYHYDPFDRKVAEEITDSQGNYKNSILYEGDSNKVLLAKNGSGQIFKYLEGQGLSEHLGEVGPSGAKAYATDHLGSVLNSEVAGQWNTFGLFGEVSANIAITPTMNPVMYAWQGLRYDAITGDYDNLARRYNQNTGTFTSQDPSGLAGGLNLYGSRNGNPLIYVDHEGESPALIAAILGGLFLGSNTANAPESEDAVLYPDEGVSSAIEGTLAGYTIGEAVCRAPGLVNNRYLRIGEGKFPEPYSKRISIGSQQGSKFEVGVSPKGKVVFKAGKVRKTIIKGR